MALQVFFCTTLTLLKYDKRFKSLSPVAKINGYNEVTLLWYKIIMIIVFAIFNKSS